MEYKAIHRFADVGPRKIRLFADLIRGKNVDEALQLLEFYPNRGAMLLRAVVQSAYGNAEHLECPDADGLIVSECRVDGAPFFKRIQPRARGTAFQIKCRMSHIVVTLSEPEYDSVPSSGALVPTAAAPTIATPDAPASTPTQAEASAPASPAAGA